ncbi:MAG: AtpZ/AtpI family protein [Flavobacterium sp.]|nr:AtpZ/AtpI family protein [Flavobacterium sp.]
MTPNSNQNKNNYKKWLGLINIPFQMGIIIFLSYKLGFWLDSNYENPKFFYYKVFTLLGVFLAIYNVYRQVNELGKNE